MGWWASLSPRGVCIPGRWNCLGGGIQYLLPTMIEPQGEHGVRPREDP